MSPLNGRLVPRTTTGSTGGDSCFWQRSSPFGLLGAPFAAELDDDQQSWRGAGAIVTRAIALAGAESAVLSRVPHSGSPALAYAYGVHPLLASFIELDAPDGSQLLRQAVLDRRFGRGTLSFKGFDVSIDAEARTVTLRRDCVGR